MDDIWVAPLCALAGVIVGGLLSFFKDTWIESRQRKREMEYHSIQLIHILSAFIDECVNVVQDDGLNNGRPSNDGSKEPQVSLPIIDFSEIETSWKSLPAKHTYEILNLQLEAKKANRYIEYVSQMEATAPDFEELFDARILKYGNLGLLAMNAVNQLREINNLPKPESENSKWSNKMILIHALNNVRNKMKNRDSEKPMF